MGVDSLVNDPQFQTLGPADQREALARVSKDEDFRRLSDDETKQFVGRVTTSPTAKTAAVLGADPQKYAQRQAHEQTAATQMKTSLAPRAVRSGLATLPAVGGTIGGLTAAPGVVSTPVGAGLGFAAGESARQLASRAIFGPNEEPNPASREGLRRSALAGETGALMTALPAVAGPYMTGEGLYRGLKALPAARRGDEDAAAQAGEAAGEVLGGGLMLPETVRASAPAVRAGARATTRTLGAPFGLGVGGEELLTRGIQPRAKSLGFQDDLAKAKNDLIAYHEEHPIKSVSDLHEAIPEIQKKVWGKEVQPVIERHANDPIDTAPVAAAVRESIRPFTREFEPAEAERLENFAQKLERARTVGQTNELLKDINARLDSYFAKYPSARGTDLLRNPDTAGLEAARRSLRQQMLEQLESQGETGVRGARERWGALQGLSEEVERRVNVADRQTPLSLRRLLGITEAIGALASGHPLGALGYGAFELAHRMTTPDAFVRRGMANIEPSAEPAAMPAAQTVPIGRTAPPQVARLALPRGPLVTEPPADRSGPIPADERIPLPAEFPKAEPQQPTTYRNAGAGRVEATGLRDPRLGVLQPPRLTPEQKLLKAPPQEASTAELPFGNALPPEPRQPQGPSGVLRPLAASQEATRETDPAREPESEATVVTSRSLQRLGARQEPPRPTLKPRAPSLKPLGLSKAEIQKSVSEIGRMGEDKLDYLRESSEGAREPQIREAARARYEQLTGIKQPKPKAPSPLANRYPPDVLEQAEAETKGALDLSDALGRPGRYFAALSQGEESYGPLSRSDIKAGLRRGGKWYGIGETKSKIAGQFPWFKDADISASKLEAALEKGKGADYERIVSRIADGIVRERRASSEIVAQEWPDIRETIERVAEIDSELARNLTELSEGKVTLAPDALREYIREKIADATQAIQFADAFDAAIDEARQASAAPPGATDEGLHGETTENAGPATSPSELSAGQNPTEKLGVLPGFDAHIRAQREGAARVQGEQLTERMNRPPESIEPAAGEMERLSPLFRGTGASPQNEMFAAGEQNTPLAEQKPTIEAALEQHLHSMQGAEERWAQRREQGLNDADLRKAIAYEMGDGGGAEGPVGWYESRGGEGNPRFEWKAGPDAAKRELKGPALLDAVRALLKIPKPKAGE